MENHEIKRETKLKRSCQGSRRRCVDSSWENRNEIGRAYPKWPIFETEAREVGDRRYVTSAAAIRITYTSSDVDLLFERPCGNLDTK